ncbi:MAG: FtsX-like permease family protein, partial [Deltaproteobacteria bacterium]|nr:FtsX-like permease family protein [Deltaproteobacteria bacterium]
MPKSLEKQINILDFALSALWRRKLKNLGIMLVFALVIFLLGSFQMLTGALSNSAEAVLENTPEITIQKMSAGRQEGIPLAYKDKLQAIYGIRAIIPRIWGYYFDEANLANYTVLALQRNSMPSANMLNLTLSHGQFPQKAEPGSAVLGRSVHKILGLGERKIFSLFKPDLSLKSFEMTGLFSQQTDLLTNDLIVMNLADARELFAIPESMVTDLCVYVANPTEIETIAKKIAALLPDTRVLTKSHIQKTYQVVFSWRSGFASICLLTALIAFTILAWDKASGLSPEEKREIGILKILGWETADILAARFWESILVSSLAFIIGCTAAYIHVAFFDATLLKPVMVGWSVIHPPFKLLPTVAVADLMLIFSFTVMPYLGATVIPAWRCS